MELNIDWYEGQVTHFQKIRPLYEELARVLQNILERACKEVGSEAIVQSRANEVPSSAEKIIRKRAKYIDPVHQLTDLCGARVIAETKDEVTRFCTFVEKNFEIHEEEDASERLGTGEFGYGSVHYIVSLKRGVFEDMNIPKTLFDRYKEPKARKRNRSDEHSVVHIGPKFKAENQVRTLLQHAGAQLAHIEEKLKAVGMEIRKVKGRQPSLMTFTEEEVETMAKMEHGRWNAERLLAGWQLSEERNPEKKLSPYLVQWDDLSEGVKKWDRQAVEQIP